MAVEVADDVELAAVGLVTPEISIRLVRRKEGEAAAGAHLTDLVIDVRHIDDVGAGDAVLGDRADELAVLILSTTDCSRMTLTCIKFTSSHMNWLTMVTQRLLIYFASLLRFFTMVRG